jgi:putative membrane protein
MLRFIVRMLITGAAVFALARYSGGALLKVDDFWTAVFFAVVLGFLNGAIRPVVKLLALPLTILSLGLFSLLINLAFFYLAAWITGVQTQGPVATIVAAVLVAIAAGIAGALTSRGER